LIKFCFIFGLFFVSLFQSLAFSAEITRKITHPKPPVTAHKEVVVYQDTKELARYYTDMRGNVILESGHIPNGVVHMRYETGGLMNEVYYKKNRLQGEETIYYPSGEVRETFTYVNGKKEGIAKSYFKNGLLEQIRSYKDGRVLGLYKGFYANGNLQYVLTFVPSAGHTPILEGESRRYHANGALREHAFYKEGRLHGPHKTYDAQGRLTKESHYFRGWLVIWFKEYDVEGSIVREGHACKVNPCDEKKLTGIFSTVLDGSQFEISLKNGKRQGLKKVTDSKGRISAEYRFQDDKLQGISSRDDGYGGRIESLYEKGKLLIESRYDDRGTLIFERNNHTIKATDIIKSLAAAAERYREDHDGDYPKAVKDLVLYAELPHGPHDSRVFYENVARFCDTTQHRYMIRCAFFDDTYRFSAEPQEDRRKNRSQFNTIPGGKWNPRSFTDSSHLGAGLHTGPILTHCIEGHKNNRCKAYYDGGQTDLLIENGMIESFHSNGSLKKRHHIEDGFLVKTIFYDDKASKSLER